MKLVLRILPRSYGHIVQAHPGPGEVASMTTLKSVILRDCGGDWRCRRQGERRVTQPSVIQGKTSNDRNSLIDRLPFNIITRHNSLPDREAVCVAYIA